MKRATAVRHLREMAATATEALPLRDSDLGWPLEELWAAGDLLGGDDDIDAGAVVVVLDLPPEEAPWLAIHPSAEWVGDRLRLGKRPFHWAYRPSVWPAWNPTYLRVLRFWTARAGLDEESLDTVSSAGPIAQPSPAAIIEQFTAELAVSRRHLRQLLDRYWEPGWRSEHRHPGPAEDHLWRAAQAVRELEDAIEAST